MALLGVTAWAVPMYLALVAVLSALVATVAWAVHRLRHGVGVPIWLALPLAWTAGEWLRAHLPGSLAFPWLGLGTSLTGFPELVGIAELVGARGVTFWIALVGGVAAELLVRRRRGEGALPAAVALLLLLAAPAAWGVWRAHHLTLRPAARVAVVQPEVPRATGTGPEESGAAVRRILASPTLRPEPGTVDLVVWPETVFPLLLGQPEGRRTLRFVRSYARRAGAPVLVGAFGTGPPEGRGRRNSAFLVDSSGPTGFVYHKRHLVPVVERTPLVPAGALPGSAGGRELRPGSEWPVATVGPGAGFGVLICYEAAFSSAARAYRARGADFLVNVSNDAWYGLDAPLARTTGLWQHPAHLVMRAVETRAGVARAANGGISLFVDPVGRTYGAAPLHERALRVRTVYTTGVRTLYVRWGDVVGSTAAGLALLLLLTPLVGLVRERTPTGRTE